MASGSTQPATAASRAIPTPVITLEGHEPVIATVNLRNGEKHGYFIASIAYFPDGKKMISGSVGKTARQWDLRAGKEIEKTRDVCEQEVRAVAVSRDGRWIVTYIGGDDFNCRELKAYDIETRIVKTFQGSSHQIMCIDISADSTLLAGGSCDGTTRIWSLEIDKLEAGPFKNHAYIRVGAVRFSQDSKKLAVMSMLGKCLEVWDVQTQKLDVRMEKFADGAFFHTPMFWTDILGSLGNQDATAVIH